MKIAYFAIIALLASTARAAYEASQLLPLPHTATYSPVDLRDGIAVGMVQSGSDFDLLPVLWHAEQSLPQLLTVATFGSARSINSAGIVVGYIWHSEIGKPTPASWDGDQRLDLPTGIYPYGYALGINDGGIIVGTVKPIASPTQSQPAVWINSQLTIPAGFSEASQASAIAVNAAGTVLINASFPDHDQSFLWTPTTITPISNPDGVVLYPQAINDSNIVVGNTNVIIDNQPHQVGFFWQNDVTTILPSLRADIATIVTDINNAGDILGYSYDSQYLPHPILWKNGTPIDLNSLLPENSGWSLSVATAIDNQGRIIGTGTYLGQPAAFLLTPTPEPASLSLLLPSLLLLTPKRKHPRP